MSSSEEEIFLRGSKSSAPTLSSSGRAKRAASNRVSSYVDVENSSNEEEVDEDDSDDVSMIAIANVNAERQISLKRKNLNRCQKISAYLHLRKQKLHLNLKN